MIEVSFKSNARKVLSIFVQYCSRFGSVFGIYSATGSPVPRNNIFERQSKKRICSCVTGSKVIMQGKLFQRCVHLLYCSVLSLGGNVNASWMSQPDMFTNSAQRELVSICTQSVRNCN